MAELKSCPFCGGKAKIFTFGLERYRTIGCSECGVQLPVYEIIEQAIEAWNTRPNPWHTKTPTEEGLYAVYYWDKHNPSATPHEALFDGFLSPDGEGNWIDRDGEIWFIDDDIVHWQKIEEQDNWQKT